MEFVDKFRIPYLPQILTSSLFTLYFLQQVHLLPVIVVSVDPDQTPRSAEYLVYIAC